MKNGAPGAKIKPDKNPNTPNTASPTIVGITGAIGSGKTEASRILQSLGAVVIDADQLAREVVAPKTEGLAQIRSTFGEKYITKDGNLDRRALGELVFSNKTELRKLEAILHPLIRKLFKAKLATILASTNPQPKLIVYDVPLFFESGLTYEDLKAIIVVSAPREICLDRIVKRSGLTREAAALRFDSQIPLAQKEARADYVIRNDKGIAELRTQVSELYKRLLAI